MSDPNTNPGAPRGSNDPEMEKLRLAEQAAENGRRKADDDDPAAVDAGDTKDSSDTAYLQNAHYGALGVGEGVGGEPADAGADGAPKAAGAAPAPRAADGPQDAAAAAATEDAPFVFDASTLFPADLVEGGGSYLVDGPDWLNIDPATGELSGAPENGDVGQVGVTVSFTPEGGETTDADLSITVENVNDAPTVTSIDAQTTLEDDAFAYDAAAHFDDVDVGDSLTYAVEGPDWLIIDPLTGQLSGTPDNDDVGAVEVTVTATDDSGERVSTTFTLTVVNVNDAPTVTGVAPQTAAEDAGFSFDAGAHFDDVDAEDVLTYSVSGPDWLVIDPVTGELSGTPDNGDVGAFEVTVTAADASGADVSTTFSLVVENVNDAPTVTSISDMSTDEDAGFSYDAAAHFDDVDAGDVLTYSVAGPDWLSIDQVTGELSGAPDNGDVGAVAVTVTATDAAGADVSATFQLTVENTNDAPTVTAISDMTSDEDATFTYGAAAHFGDIDAGDVLVYAVEGPDWLNIDPATGELSGTPENGDVGTAVVTVTATDTSGASVSTSFNVTVDNVNDAPTVTPVADMATSEDAAFSYDAAAHFDDVDAGDVLTYSVSGPDWLTVDPTTGELSGTPDNGDVGSVAVTVTAADTSGATASTSFNLTVDNVNDAPTVTSISDMSADEDTGFSYDAAAHFDDVDAGDVLTYSVTGPDWLSVDPVTGELSGTPDNGDVGSADVTVTATDVSGASVSTTFSLNVDNTNDGPVSVTVAAGPVDENDAGAVVGAVSVDDPDVGDTHAYTVDDPRFEVAGGVLKLKDGVSLDHESEPTVDVVVTATDAAGESDSTTLTVNVADVNEAPVDILFDSAHDQVGFNTGAGNNEYLVAANGGDAIAGRDDFTVEVSFAGTEQGSNFTPLFSYNAPGGDNEFLIGGHPSDGDLSVFFRGQKVRTGIDLDDLFDGGQHTVSVVRESGDGSLDVYVDGNLMFSASGVRTGLTVRPGGAIVFGQEQDGVGGGFATSQVFTGEIFEARIFEDARTAGEIAGGANAHVDPASDNLAALWDMRTFSGGQAGDGAGGGVDLVEGAIAGGGWVDDAGLSEPGLAEGAGAGTVVGVLSAVDPDAGDVNFTYDIVGGDANFEVVGDEIRVRAGADLDFETASSHDLLIRVTDAGGLTFEKTITIDLADVNEAPTFTLIADQSADEDAGFAYDAAAHFDDVDAGDSLTYSVAGPDWLVIDPVTGELSGTPDNGDVGSVGVTVTATDSGGLSASTDFTLTVVNVNDAPTVTAISDMATDEDAGFAYDASAHFDDVDAGDVLTYSMTGPDWLSVDPVTGELSGAPGNGDVGVASVTVTATDTSGAAVSTTFDITVDNVNDTPTVTAISDMATDEDAGFSYDAAAHFDDVDAGDALTYAVSGPDWLSVDPVTGQLSGTPDNGDVGSAVVTVTATDAAGDSASTSFTVDVANVNDAPTVTPIGDMTTDEDAAFTYDAATHFDDVDAGDSLSYAVTGPDWLSIDPATGELSGTPANDDVGPVDVTVTATDGAGESVSSTFTLDVANTNDAPTFAFDAGQPGLVASYFDVGTSLSQLSDVDWAAAPDHVEVVGSIDHMTGGQPFWSGGPDNYFAARYEGDLVVDTGGSYTFALASDDGSALYIDGVLVLGNDGLHGARTQTATVNLSAGHHDVEVRYFENGGAQTLRLQWAGPDTGGATQTISGDSYQHGGYDPDTGEAHVNEHDAGATVATFTVTDPDVGDSHTFAVDDARFEVMFDNGAPTLKLKDGETLSHEDDGAVTVNVTVTDAAGASSTQPITVVVDNVNDAPTVDYADLGQGLRASYYDIGTGLSNLSQVDWSATPDHVDVVDSIDHMAGSDPFWSGGPGDYFAAKYDGDLMVSTGGDYTFSLTSDDGSALYVDGVLVLGNDGLHATSTQTATLTLTPGAHAIEVRFFENTGSQTLQLSWSGPDTGGATQVIGGAAFQQDAGANDVQGHVSENDAGAVAAVLDVTDPDAGDTHTFGVDDARFEVVVQDGRPVLKLKDGESLDHESEPTVPVTVTVTDAAGESSQTTFDIQVDDVAEAPTAAPISDQATAEDAPFSFDAGAAFDDPDGGALTFAMTGPAWASIDPVTGVITGTPDNDDVGSTAFTVTATDPDGESVSTNFNVAVDNTNDAPTAIVTDIAPVASLPGAPLVFRFSGDDRDGNGAVDPAGSDGDVVSSWRDSVGGRNASGTNAALDADGLPGGDTVDFAGASGTLKFGSDAAVNNSTFTEKSFAFAFTTGDDVSGTQVIYEQGGNARGYSLAIAPDPSTGDPTLYAFAYNDREWAPGEQFVAVSLGPVTANTTYTAAMVHDATSADPAEQTFAAYLNGELMGVVDHVAPQHGHSGAPGIGGVGDNSVHPVTHAVITQSGTDFQGAVADVMSWNAVFDAPAAVELHNWLDLKWSQDVDPDSVTPTGISEHATAGAVVGHVNVVDVDAGDAHAFVVSDPRFEVIGDELRVASGASFDFETEPSIDVTITATDSGGASIATTVTVSVLQANDAPTDIDAAFGPFLPGGAIFDFNAADLDGDGAADAGMAAGDAIAAWTDSAAGNTADPDAAAARYDVDADGHAGVDFSNTNDALEFNSSSDVNQASTYAEKSFAFSFTTGADVSGTQVIYEQGGGTRGYVLAIAPDPSNGGAPTLYAFVYNKAEWNGAHRYKSINMGEVQADTTYSAVMVHDATGSNPSSQTWSAWLDGQLVGTETHAGVQHAHGDAPALGGVNSGILHPVTYASLGEGDATDFEGVIHQATSWNAALDSAQVSQAVGYHEATWGQGSAGHVQADAAPGVVVAHLSAIDPDGDSGLVFSVPSDVPFDVVGSDLVVKGGATLTAGDHDVLVTVTDPSGESYSETFTVTVAGDPATPPAAPAAPPAPTPVAPEDVYVLGARLDDTVDGVAGWVDAIEIGRSAEAVHGDWVVTLDNGDTVTADDGAGFFDFGADTSGFIQFDDGARVDFTDIDTIQWN